METSKSLKLAGGFIAVFIDWWLRLPRRWRLWFVLFAICLAILAKFLIASLA